MRVSVDGRGVLHFSGQDFGGFAGTNEYEYELTVEAADVGRVRAALDPQPGEDVVALLCRNAKMIMRTGEQQWLRSLGIEPGFWSHFGFD